jgi:hypothetical protein
MPKKAVFFLCFPLFGCLFSCSKNDNRPSPISPPPKDTVIHVTSVTVDPAQFILITKMTRQLNATIAPNNAPNKDLTWTTSDNTIATVDPYGKVTAVSEGTVMITAASKIEPSVKMAVKLIVLKNYDVYAVGTGQTSSWNNAAVLWKNDTATVLNGGYLVGSEAYAITLDGNDVYIAGSTLNANMWDIPTYWKNGNPHIVGDNTVSYNTFTRGIALYGGKVYVAGYSFNSPECPAYCNGRSRASYWVDDGGTITQTSLVDSISSTMAYGIAINGSDVVVAGARANDNLYQWSIGWKNDVSHGTTLSPVDGFYSAASVASHGNDIYFVGSGGCANFGCNAKAYIWKNDISQTTPLTDGTADARATCMAFSGDTLYIGGYIQNASNKKIATYWRVIGNQASSPRFLSDGTNDCTVNGIAVSGNDIFLVGMAIPYSGGSSAAAWRSYEGASVPISIDATGYYVANGNVAWGVYVR